MTKHNLKATDHPDRRLILAKKKIRILSGIMAFMMLFVIVFFTVFIAREAGHKCHGEDCPICECIASCLNVLNHVGAVPGAVSGIVFIAVVYVLTSGLFGRDIRISTPVSEKIRLND